MSQISPGKNFSFGQKKRPESKKSFDSGLCLVDILLCDAFTLVRVPPDGSRIIQKRHAATALFWPSRREKSPEFRAFFVLGSFCSSRDGRGRRTRTLGTRFWSGCENSAQRAGEGRCCPILLARTRKGGAVGKLSGEKQCSNRLF